MAKSSTPRPSGKKPAPLAGNSVWKERSRVRPKGPRALAETSWWDARPLGVQHAICLTALALVGLAFYAQTTFGGRTFVGGDTLQWRATAQAMLEHEAATGDTPLWSPNTFAGMPGTLVYYPHAVPGVDTAVNVLRVAGLWPLAHQLALLAGAYFLGFYLTRRSLAGVVAAVAYGFTTYLPIFLTAGHNTKFVALAYAPWLMLAVAALFGRRADATKTRSALLTLLFAIAAAVHLRAGHVQITYILVVASAVWWIVEAAAAVRQKEIARFAVTTGLFVAGAALALAMVAQPYLAQWEVKPFTTRTTGEGGGLAWDYAMEWSQGWGEMLTLLIPNAFGGASPLYWGPKVFTSGPHYVGPVVALLALVGAFGVARRQAVALGAVVLLFLGFALGDHFALLNRPAFAVLPLFSSFRVPETWLVVATLFVAALAAFGASALVRREATDGGEARKRRLVLGAGGALVLVVGGLWVTGGGPLSFEKPGEQAEVAALAAQQFGLAPGDPQALAAADEYLRTLRADRADAFRADAGRSLLILLLAVGLAAALAWNRGPQAALVAGLALLAAVDLFGVGRRFVNDDSPSLQRRTDAEAVLERQKTPADDFLLARVAEAGGPGHFRVLPPQPVTNARPSFFYESVGGYHGAKLASVQAYFDDVLPDEQTGVRRAALDVLGVRYVVAGGPLPGLRPVFQDAATGETVLEVPDAAPRAFFADSVALVGSSAEARAALAAPGASARTARVTREALTAAGTTAEALTGAPPDSGAVAVALTRFAPDEIVWRVRTDRPRLFVAAEMWYPPGWTATLGEAPAELVEVNGLVRGVPVPAGEHLLTMRYAPASHRTGVLVSLLAHLLAYGGALGLGAMLWYRRGHPKP